MGSPAFCSRDCNPPPNRASATQETFLCLPFQYHQLLTTGTQQRGGGKAQELHPASSQGIPRNPPFSSRLSLHLGESRMSVHLDGFRNTTNCPPLPTQQRLTSYLFLGVRRGHFVNSWLWTEIKEAMGVLKSESQENLSHTTDQEKWYHYLIWTLQSKHSVSQRCWSPPTVIWSSICVKDR